MLLNRAEIIRLLGDVDDVIIAQIVASGTTADELAEAQAWVSNDEPCRPAVSAALQLFLPSSKRREQSQ
jgi:hypothetical protein